MARVAAELGVTTMALYRYVANKDELLQLMWNAGSLGAEHLVLEGDGWRGRLRSWAVIQRDILDRHPWITQLPMATPPLGPNSLHFVERALEAMDETGLPDEEKIQVIGMISTYTLSEARMAADAMRAVTAAMAAAAQAGAVPSDPAPADSGADGPPGPPQSFEALLRELVDEQTYPRLYRLAWQPEPENPPSEREQYLFGVDTILDGVQALIDRAGRGY
jgi:AcrR family transcriptional regulator